MAARFRWVKPAASLKRRNETVTVTGNSVFPLGKTGGLIEARLRAPMAAR